MSVEKTYLELKKELEDEIAWFESDEISLEEVDQHYKNALDLMKKIEKKLNDKELEITKLK